MTMIKFILQFCIVRAYSKSYPCPENDYLEWWVRQIWFGEFVYSGRNEPAYVCNKNHLLTETEAQLMDRLVVKLRSGAHSQCTSANGDRLRLSVAIVEHEADSEAELNKFASALRHAWKDTTDESCDNSAVMVFQLIPPAFSIARKKNSSQRDDIGGSDSEPPLTPFFGATLHAYFQHEISTHQDFIKATTNVISAAQASADETGDEVFIGF